MKHTRIQYNFLGHSRKFSQGGWVATTVAVVGAATSVASAQSQKKAAKKAAGAFQGVGTGIEKMDKMEASMRQLMGVPKEDAGGEKDTYNILRTQGNKIVEDQQAGRLSEPTRVMLGRRALSSGAVGLGRGAVDDAYTGYLGLSMEAQAQQGFANYRNMWAQLNSAAQNQQAQNYNMQYNAAAVQANTAMAIGNADAAMWKGIGSAVGGFVGGVGGGAGAGAGGMGSGGGGGGWMSLLGSGGGGYGGMNASNNGGQGFSAGSGSAMPSGYRGGGNFGV